MAADIYRAYYTKSMPIVNYMVNQLAATSGQRVLEPCAGEGTLVDALPEGVQVDVFELDPQAVACLQQKYAQKSHVHIVHEDTLTAPQLLGQSALYDGVIANPPYGGWQDYDRRAALKQLYPGLYIKETYTLFLYRCIQLLRESGRLVFILPDTFLHLHRHTALRKYLWTHTRVEEIVTFPSAFFPGVNFGYAKLALITLEKCADESACLENTVRVFSGLQSVEDLAVLSTERYLAQQCSQREILANMDHALFISDQPRITDLINQAERRIGDLADCVTGFYSGDDRRFLRTRLPGVKKYAVLDQKQVYSGQQPPALNGITEEGAFIAIVKGGAVRYIKPDDWYMEWSAAAVAGYKTSKKARFQNVGYYFREGLAVPMVSSSRITAALLEGRLFDQSIVGIFPKEDRWLYYLLAFFNTPTCNYLIRTINPSANNSAKYIQKIPFIVPSPSVYRAVVQLVSQIIACLKRGQDYDMNYDAQLAALFYEVYGF